MTAAASLVVRHGESTWNAVRRWQGQADPPLSERGEKQARRGAIAAADHGPFDAVVTSTLQRAHRTGELIAAGLGVPLLSADRRPRRSDRRGSGRGSPGARSRTAFPATSPTASAPTATSPTRRSSNARVGALRRLAADHADRTLLVVSHGGIIHALEQAHAGDDEWQRLDNLTGRWFEVTR